MNPSPPRVVVIGLGGTIAMTSAASGGVSPALTAADLLAAVPQLAGLGLEIQAEDFRQLPGASLDFDDLVELASTLRKRLDDGADGADGIVITQGTDTIEESAYFVDLLHRGPEPVVVTGAMRNPTLAGADGAANLLAAVQVAGSPEARDQGCLVVLADEIHAARHVQKTHSTGVATFQSPDSGPLGYLVEGEPRFVNRIACRQVLPEVGLAQGDGAPRVGLITVTLGDDGTLLTSAAGQLDGVVVAALGAGHVPARLLEPLGQLAAAIPVVLATRTGAGPVLSSTYGFPGSEASLLEAGLIPAGFLHPLKARVLLYALLAAGTDRPTIAAALSGAGAHSAAAGWPWPQ